MANEERKFRIAGRLRRLDMNHRPEAPEQTQSGLHKMEAEVSTGRTSARCLILSNGSVSVEVKRDGAVIHSQGYGPQES